VRAATDHTDLTAELKRGLSYVRRKKTAIESRLNGTSELLMFAAHSDSRLKYAFTGGNSLHA